MTRFWIAIGAVLLLSGCTDGDDCIFDDEYTDLTGILYYAWDYIDPHGNGQGGYITDYGDRTMKSTRGLPPYDLLDDTYDIYEPIDDIVFKEINRLEGGHDDFSPNIEIYGVFRGYKGEATETCNRVAYESYKIGGSSSNQIFKLEKIMRVNKVVNQNDW